MATDRLLSIRATLATLDMSRSTLWRLRKLGLLPTVKVGSIVRFRESDLKRLMTPEPAPAERGRA